MSLADEQVSNAAAPASVTDHRLTRVLQGLVILLAAALVATGALTVYFGLHHAGQDQVVADSQQALAAASAEIVPVTSYSYQHLGADEARALAVLTPSFGAMYATVLEKDAKAAVEQYHAVVSSVVIKSAIEQYGTSRAVIMVFLDQTSTETVRAGQQTSGYRLLVSMQKIRSHWLISYIDTL